MMGINIIINAIFVYMIDMILTKTLFRNKSFLSEFNVTSSRNHSRIEIDAPERNLAERSTGFMNVEELLAQLDTWIFLADQLIHIFDRPMFLPHF